MSLERSTLLWKFVVVNFHFLNNSELKEEGNKTPLKGDTLSYGKTLYLTLNIDYYTCETSLQCHHIYILAFFHFTTVYLFIFSYFFSVPISATFYFFWLQPNPLHFCGLKCPYYFSVRSWKKVAFMRSCYAINRVLISDWICSQIWIFLSWSHQKNESICNHHPA